jgi:hypothetical protein
VTKNTVGRTFQPTKCLVHSSQCEVAVIGAGPYGLSAGAHLKAKSISARVFGEPREFWAKKMPEGNAVAVTAGSRSPGVDCLRAGFCLLKIGTSDRASHFDPLLARGYTPPLPDRTSVGFR